MRESAGRDSEEELASLLLSVAPKKDCAVKSVQQDSDKGSSLPARILQTKEGGLHCNLRFSRSTFARVNLEVASRCVLED